MISQKSGSPGGRKGFQEAAETLFDEVIFSDRETSCPFNECVAPERLEVSVGAVYVAVCTLLFVMWSAAKKGRLFI